MSSLNQRQKAVEFVKYWKDADQKEEEQARSFWIDLAEIFGVENPTHALEFERKIKGRKIDVFYPDMKILIENKSGDKDLDKTRDNGEYGKETPFDQAMWYANNMVNSIRPRWIITTNFNTFRIYDLEHPEDKFTEISLEELPDKLNIFKFFTDTSQDRLILEKKLSIEAGEIVGKLYKSFAKQYKNIENDPKEQLSLNILMVRIVFLLYAEDAGILQEHLAFNAYMKSFEVPRMRDALISLFRILDTKEDDRDPYESSDLLAFPYINGGLFKKEDIIVPQFTDQMRFDLLYSASQQFDWKDISPTIFGAVFESTLNPETRRSGGMHFTSIENIHKVIDPLFLNDLTTELEEIEALKTEKTRNLKLRGYQQKLASINILDPACGSGNFLTESYLSLRRLENRVIEDLYGAQSMIGFSDDPNSIIKVNLTQFYGIEINDFAVHVAKTALWIAESQMIDATQEIIYQVIDFLPLKTTANITEANALQIDWNEVLPDDRCTYICGNPPFTGASYCSKKQKQDIVNLYGKIKLSNSLDYVSGWYYKACDYMQNNTKIRSAFVSTNSITQGEQVYPIWNTLTKRFNVRTNFAYTTFIWNSEATDQAHVHVVIIGFSLEKSIKPYLIVNDGALTVKNINPYLIDAPTVYIGSRSKTLVNIPRLTKGNQPSDGGNLILEDEEYKNMIKQNPEAQEFLHPYIGARDYLHGGRRWCIWLKDVPKNKYINIIPIMDRLKKLKYLDQKARQLQQEKKQKHQNYFFLHHRLMILT